MDVKHISGRNKGKIMLYALSTCPWCIKTKELLKSLAVEFFYIDMDKLDGRDKNEAFAELEKWNPDFTFPSLVLDESLSIIGFDEKRIREKLEG